MTWTSRLPELPPRSRFDEERTPGAGLQRGARKTARRSAVRNATARMKAWIGGQVRMARAGKGKR